jgi:hypothetical protein
MYQAAIEWKRIGRLFRGPYQENACEAMLVQSDRSGPGTWGH